MLSLALEPQEICFSKDPIVFDFQTDNLIVSAGVAAVNVVAFSGGVAEDEVMILRWGGTELRMVAKATPALAHEFPSATTDLAVLLPYFRDNYTLDKDFVVSIVSGGLHFTARNAGTKYNFSTISFAGGTVSANVPGVDAVIRKNFSVYYELYVEQADAPDSYYKLSAGNLPVDSNTQRCRLDLSPLLHSALEPDMPYDFLTTTALCQKSKRRYYLRIAETFGEKPQIQRITKLEPKHVVLGGTSKQNRKTVIGKLLGVSASVDACLRYGDTNRYILQDAPQYLYFLMLRAATGIQLKATIYYADDTSEVKASLGYLGAKYDKVFFDASLSVFEPNASKTVVMYEVCVVDASNGDAHISKTYTYIIDYAFRKTVRRFLYVNSVGGADSFLTFGKGTKEIEFFKQTAEKADDDVTVQQFQDYAIEGRENYEVATGFKSKRELAYMRDFFLSEDKFVMRSGRWLPIQTNNRTIQESVDGNNLQGYKFEYSLAHRDDSLSDDDVSDIIGFPLPPQGFLGGGDLTINLGAPGTIIIDEYPTLGSTNAVASGGVYNYLLLKQDKIILGTQLQYFRGDLSLGTLGEDIEAILTATQLTDLNPTGAKDEVNRVFRVAQKFKPGSTKVYRNGVRQYVGDDYVEVGNQDIEFVEAPSAEERIIIDFQKST